MSIKKTAGLSAVATVSSVVTDDMFVSGAIIEHEVTLGDGVKRTLYFKEISAIEFKQHFEAESSKDPKVRKESTARLIARSLVEPDGRRAITPQRASVLKPAVSGAIFMAILRINGILPKQVETPVADDAQDEDDDEIADVEDEVAGD